MKQVVFIVALMVCLFFPAHPLWAEPMDESYRFPDLYNPNPLGGRIWLQPLGIHDDRVTDHAEICLNFGSSTDYNVNFIETPGDKELTVNTNIYTLSLARSMDMVGRRVEMGGIFRSHQDMRSTLGSSLVKRYHEAFPSDGFGHVPPEGQYYGAVGDNETAVIGESREFYLNTLQLYAKYQLCRETTGFMDSALKLSIRVPLSGKSFDKRGIALSAGFSKQMGPHLRAIGSGGLVFQDLDAKDFDANNLDVASWVYDVFAGLVWDMGRPGGWYAQAGMRYASKRVSYIQNSDSAAAAVVTHFGPVYRFREKQGRVIEWFMSFNEDIPGLGYGLEPDVAFYTGVSVLFR
ncbi:MAG: hypothetical protein KKD44_06145 [Proteobacteria bacterium]|nr:hypothetical protein [Pseudomonadota bacterium]